MERVFIGGGVRLLTSAATLIYLYVPALIFGEGGLDAGEEFDFHEYLVGSAGGPVADEAESVFVAVQIGDLLDGGLFEVVGQGSLASAGSGSGEYVAAGVGDAALLAPGAEACGEGDDA